MGDINQLNFIKENLNIILGPILEIGSKDYGNTPNLRQFFPDFEYIGIDLEAGNGVDLVLDFTDDFEVIYETLGRKKFNTVICLSVLEHTKNPFKLCGNISNILNNNGLVFISVPFAWRIHAYPSDYWRFTPEGIKILLPNFDFNYYQNTISTSIIGEVKSLKHQIFHIQLNMDKSKIKNWKDSLQNKLFFFCRKLKILPSIFKYSRLFPPLLVNMIGRKRSSEI